MLGWIKNLFKRKMKIKMPPKTFAGNCFQIIVTNKDDHDDQHSTSVIMTTAEMARDQALKSLPEQEWVGDINDWDLEIKGGAPLQWAGEE